MRILLTVDGSAGSANAVQEVASRLWPAGSQLKVVSVVKLPFVPTAETRSLPESYYSQLEKAGCDQAENAIANALSVLQPLPVFQDALETQVIIGDPREEIIDEASRWQADLIVLSSRGLSGFKRFLLGSVAMGVLEHAPCSVLLVRTPEDDQQ